MFSVAIGPHDHNTYDGKYHNQIERHSRIKHNFDKTQEFFNDYYKPNNPLCITATIGGIENTGFNHKCLSFKPKKLWDYWYEDNLYYIDHHQSHAVYALLTSGFSQSDVLAIDGRGWNYKCVFFDKNGNITDLSNKIQIGLQWNYFSKRLGFGDLGAGKLMGLSAYGEYNIAIHLAIENQNYDYLLNAKKEDIAATLQHHTIELVKQHVLPLKSCDNICVAGGVAYNGYMNEEFTKHYDKVHVPPAPGDEGQSLGTYMHADYILNNNIHVPETYAGKEYNFDEGDPITPREVGEAIAAGKIVGWFHGKSESGNRALGNRSILADPRNPKIKDIINKTIKQREDFRPFAPSVLEGHYPYYFNTNQSSPYMSRIVPVKSHLYDVIPGVTHVDGTARIQTVNRKQNEKFHEVIQGFYQATGVPMVLNTSFNCKEPIVETPEDAINTFNKTQLDMLVINERSVRKMG
jgi:carbamoyltransferase